MNSVNHPHRISDCHEWSELSKKYIAYHEDIICLWHMTSSLKKFHQVVKLTVNVTTNRYRTVDRLHVRLLNEDLFYLLCRV